MLTRLMVGSDTVAEPLGEDDAGLECEYRVVEYE